MNEQVRATLAPLSNLMRQRHAMAHPISQVSLTLGRNAGTLVWAQEQVLRWVAERSGRRLPDAAWRGEPFELDEIGAQPTQAVAIDDSLWAVRCDDADKNVPSRAWVTEAVLGEGSAGVLLGVRLTAVVRGPDQPFVRSIPKFVRAIVAAGDARLDGCAVGERAKIVATEDDVEWLVELLLDRSRRADLIVAALPEGSIDPCDAMIDTDALAKSVVGAAHVVVLTGPASFHLSDMIGREFSVYRQAVRTYRAHFDHEQDDPYDHPLILPHKIDTWQSGRNGFARAIAADTLRRSVAAVDREHLVPSFAAVRQAASAHRLQVRAIDHTDTEQLALYKCEIASLAKQLDEQKTTYDALLVQAEAERDVAETAARTAKYLGETLRVRIRTLERRVEQAPAVQEDIPTSIIDFERWCEQNLAGSVLLLGRAHRGMGECAYEDVPLIYRALLLLRDQYVPMRREGGEVRQRDWLDACEKLGIDEAPTGARHRAGEEGQEYFVKHNGKRVFMERHLKKGTSHEPRYCFRLYFFWDAAEQMVVVGWLPSHLNSRAT